MASYFKYLILFLLMITPFTSAYAKEGIVFDRYFLNKVKNEKIGYSHISQKKVRIKGQDAILTHKHSEQEFKRYGLPIDVLQDFKFYESLKGEPIYLEAYSKMGDEVLQYDADFLPNQKVLLTYKTNDVDERKHIVLDNNILFPYAISNLFKDKKDEAVIEYSTIEPENDFRIVNIKAIKERDKGKYNVYVDMLPNIKNERWRDDEGHIVKEYSPVLNLAKVSVDKDEIFADSQDVFHKSRITSSGKIENISNIKEITYKIFLNDYSLGSIPTLNKNQRIIQSKDGIAYLKVKVDNYANQKFKYPPRSKSLKKYLLPTKLLDFNNENLKKYVKQQMAKRPRNAYEFAKGFEKYVYEQIKLKNNKTKIALASETFEAKSGDATDKAVLLASMLRAAKIPAKIVVGTKYTNTPDSSFIYHPWVMAYVGSWVCLDPNSKDERFGVNHIALYDVDLASDNVENQVFFDFLNKLSSMKIVILDFSLLHNPSGLEKDLKTVNHYSESGLVDYIRNSGMNLNEAGIKNEDYNDRALAKLKNIEAKKYFKEATTYYVSGEIDRAIINFERVFELTPVNDDYLNVDYANRMASLGLFNLAKHRLANISEHKIWSNKIEALYKMYMPKIMPEYIDEKALAKTLSRIEFAPDSIDLDDKVATLSSKKYKKSDYAHYLLSKLYFVKGDNKKAYSHIKKALRINPLNFIYHTHKLNILSSSNKNRLALKEINWLLRQSEITSENTYGLELHKQYLLAKKQRNFSKRNYHMAKFYVLSNQNYKAKRILEKEIKIARKKDKLYVLLGKVYYNLKNTKAAKENFLMALTYNKRNLKALEGLGDLKYLEYKPDDAIGYYSKVLKKKKKAHDVILKVANCHRDMINEKDALYNYFQVLRLDPNNYQSIYNIAKIKGKYGEKSDMSDIYKQILNINPNYTPAWYGLINIAIRNKNSFLARKYLKPVFYIDKNNPESYYYSGLIEVMNENYAYARRDFKRSLQLDSNFVKSKFELDKLK